MKMMSDINIHLENKKESRIFFVFIWIMYSLVYTTKMCFSASLVFIKQEGILSLMQMAKTCGALERHAEADLPYIAILTNPTYGGISASFATVGDIIIAEPGAMIGFAGPRVIQETTNAKLPPGFQTAEFLLEKGLIDRVVERKNLRRELALLLEIFAK